MQKTFQLFRLTLLEKSQHSLFGNQRQTREQYLRETFSTPHVFERYAKTFHYVPMAAQTRITSLIGRIGTQISLPENKPPQDGLAEQTHDTWKAAFVVFDPSDHVDGQKVAVQIDRQVGEPKAIISGLVKKVNEASPTSRFDIEAQPIFDVSTFWDFASTHKGKIVSLTFDLMVPNGLFSANETIAKELENAKKETNATAVVSTFKADKGLNTDGQAVKDAVQYAQKGSGEIRAKTINGRTYNSENKPVIATIDVTEPTLTLDVISSNVARILGRDPDE
jgi:hypothetical protein